MTNTKINQPKLRAVGDRVIVKPLKREQSRSGLILPDDDTDPVQRGEVVSVGEQADFGGALKTGDVVLFKRNATWELDESLIWIKGEHVLAKIKK